MARLQVNVDHVATLRQARRASVPDPARAAAIAEAAGATGITVHLREDRRHIQDRDVEALRGSVRTRLNLEMAATDEMLAIALRLRPDQVTIVPERRAELTTEGGLDAERFAGALEPYVGKLRAGGLGVSLFVDPLAEQVDAAARVGASAVELHTGAYAEARGGPELDRQFAALEAASARARKAGLIVHLGHGLDYDNVERVAAIEGIDELNIGFSIVARALSDGFERAVAEMVERIRRASRR